MKIEMSDLREGPVTLEVNAQPRDLELQDPEFEFDSPVKGTVIFHAAGSTVLANGELETSARGKCVRCLEPARATIKAPVQVMYQHNPDLLKPDSGIGESEHEAIAYFDGESIEPQPELREAIMLELPGLPVCSPECRGLCPDCGANLNTDPCNCAHEQEESGDWKSELKKLKNKAE